ncbi:uncharacterized protein LOC123537251 [Mercenaria mercenaria]|uniref:uncharacterized protein LOC123537251 n=2 Tax=Mercenaria mercenaria TaxID=6596 RepID=UPI00234EEB1C|nr:uncharacterized protein LOC123537251 [Mercenaria mercenaria]XP_045176836.2 uncharacterized protein LOC123537251 [Mercenaria mercenaria]
MRTTLLSVLSIIVYVNPVHSDIDYTVCNPLNATVVPPPPPELAKSYSTRVEWKWLNTNTTVDITEIYNGITQMGSQDMYIEGQDVKVIYDYKENQYITYTQRDGCVVKGLGTLAFYDNKIWLTAFKLLYNIARRADVAYAGQAYVRSTLTEKFRTCLFLYQFNITVEFDMYFSAFGWGMALSRPDEMVPVRLEMRGSVTHNNTKAGVVPFHVVGDFIEFNPKPVADEAKMQVPPGIFCSGRFSRKPMNILPTSFSLVYEKIDLDYSKITYESIWFDSNKKLVRRDYKEASGNDPDPTSEIFDFNLGIHYSIDSYMGSCEPISPLDLGDLFVANNGNSTIRMMSADEFFHSQNAEIQYVGTRLSRGVTCDVWAGLYLDVEANRNFTIEWYFTQDHWLEAVGGIIQPASLFRIDIWQGGLDKPIVYNVLKFNSEPPTQDVFDVGQCFVASHKTRLLVHFAVVNNGSLDTVSHSYLKETLHIRLVTAAFLPPLRLSKVSIEFVGMTDVYVDTILLDNTPLINTKIVPLPKSQHSMEAAYEFLKGQIGGRLQIRINSTTHRKGVVLESRGILKIDYSQEFTTTTTSLTTTTTEATPPLPEIPSTLKPLVPTKYNTPETLPTSAPCTCPPVTCPAVSSTPCPTLRQITQKRCPEVTCPPLTCPSCPVQTRCPTISCPTVPPCTPTPCSKSPLPTPCPTVAQIPCSNKTCPSPTSCPKLTCPKTTCPKVTCPVVKPCKPTPCSTQQKPSPCPTQQVTTPCPNSPGNIGHQKQSNQNNDNSSGMEGGAVAGIALVMLAVGIALGFIAVLVYRKYRTVAPDKRNILDKYLDTDERY